MLVVVPVVMPMVFAGRSALTGRLGRHSTPGLAVVAAASLTLAQFDEGVGHSHPQFRREGRVVGGPVGQQGSLAGDRPGLVSRLWHNAQATANTVTAPVAIPSNRN